MGNSEECDIASEVNVTRQPGKTFSLTWYASNGWHCCLRLFFTLS